MAGRRTVIRRVAICRNAPCRALSGTKRKNNRRVLPEIDRHTLALRRFEHPVFDGGDRRLAELRTRGLAYACIRHGAIGRDYKLDDRAAFDASTLTIGRIKRRSLAQERWRLHSVRRSVDHRLRRQPLVGAKGGTFSVGKCKLYWNLQMRIDGTLSDVAGSVPPLLDRCDRGFSKQAIAGSNGKNVMHGAVRVNDEVRHDVTFDPGPPQDQWIARRRLPEPHWAPTQLFNLERRNVPGQ